MAQIRVGQTTGLSGAVAATVGESNQGALLAIDAANAKGGVNGQKIELISMDDKFDPKLAVENARVLIEEKKVSLIFLTRGTPHNVALMPLLEKNHIALLAPSTGAMVLRNPVNPWIFNVRTPYQVEAQKAIALLSSIGLQRIGVLQVNDSFGTDAIVGAQAGFTNQNLKPQFVEVFERGNPDFKKFVAQTAATQPQAVFIIGSGTDVIKAVQALRASGSAARVVTLSNNASGGFIKQLGADARGVIMTQVTPAERNQGDALVREAYALAKAKGIEELSPAMLEGFMAGKVLVEALQRSGVSPSR